MRQRARDVFAVEDQRRNTLRLLVCGDLDEAKLDAIDGWIAWMRRQRAEKS